jgi:hypothetical protein
MASFEILSGDFEPEIVRIRYSEAGRARLRLTSVDGMVEDVYLATDVAAAEAGDVRLCDRAGEGGRRARSARPAVIGDREAAAADRMFAVVLRDGRRFVARGSADTLAEIRAATEPAGRRVSYVEEPHLRVPPSTAVAHRFVQSVLARLLPGR